ncbi:MAG TPA: 5-oxoprolinase subunit PxpA [Candidatus Krumholzibacteria bacterium]|nr:5-oxoprolinase subunit PxpA [Candidatus Krumholzibacteria bacterium]
MKTIDLNCDMGELPEAVADGTQESLMQSLTSVNVACGGHAGDTRTMQTTIEQALRRRLAIGAHPGYPDRAHFGRKEMKLPPEAVRDFVFEQVRALADVAERCGATLSHVKPHGALYNQAVRDRALAQAIADGVAQCTRDVVLVGLAGSPMLDAFRERGFMVAAEAFADRRYQPDGTLRPRTFDEALIAEPEEAGRQALRIAAHRSVIAHDGTEVPVDAQTICIHGDTPGAVAIAAAVAAAVRGGGVVPRALSTHGD